MKLLGLMCAVGLVCGACGGSGSDAPTREAAFAHLPEGYALRLDRENRDPAGFAAAPLANGLHIQTGPAGIIYRPDQVAEVDRYTVSATFTEIDAPVGHREGFGLFIGGQDLQGPTQRYTYFLVRGDGRYLVKRRDGISTEEISNGWESSGAIRVPVSGGGDVTNVLAITVDGDQLLFACNGEQVAAMPAGSLSTQGVVGIRVNHNLDVRVEDLRVER